MTEENLSPCADDFPNENPAERPGEPQYSDSGLYVGRRRRRSRSPASRLVFATLLIVAGTLLFLGNLGLWPVREIWDYWPLVLIAIGVVKLLGSQYASGRVLGILLITFGTLFLTVTLRIFHISPQDDSWPISLLLIAFGVIALIKVLESGRTPKPALGFPSPSTSSEDLANTWAVFAEVKRKIDTKSFQGGEVLAIFGSVDLNLRRAEISSAGRSATIEANVIFGSIKIRVPDNWRVNLAGAAALGSYSDKTTPPAASDAATPVLTITGFAVFGSSRHRGLSPGNFRRLACTRFLATGAVCGSISLPGSR